MNYPKGINKINHNEKIINYKNRGMSLENDINETNEYYINNNIAFIYKKPTPIKLVKVDYKHSKIEEAYFMSPSTTDYNGLYKGKYIDFEAKETKTNIFPLINIHPHQIKHLENIYNNNGISFIIIRFTKYNKTYLLLTKDFLNYINNNNKKSIPIEYFEENAYLIKDKYIKRVDYIEIIDKLLGGNYEEKE